MKETISFGLFGSGRGVTSFNPVIEETLSFETWLSWIKILKNVILILKREDWVILKMKIDRHHWRMVTSESEALQVLNKCSAGEFGLSLFLMTAVLEVFRRWVAIYVMIPLGNSWKQNVIPVIPYVGRDFLADLS
jgi:hypothetical protein